MLDLDLGTLYPGEVSRIKGFILQFCPICVCSPCLCTFVRVNKKVGSPIWAGPKQSTGFDGPKIYFGSCRVLSVETITGFKMGKR